LANPPYQWTWTNPPTGLHLLTAAATDNLNGKTTSSVVSVTVLARTSLNVRQAGNQIELSWPSAGTGYTVESATNLAPPAIWTSVTNMAVLSNGMFHMFINPQTPQRYFRLRAP